MNEDSGERGFWIGIGGIAPIIVAMLLVGLGDVMRNANVAIVLTLVVVAVAAGGGRETGIVAAVSAALSFNFFHTRPYLKLTIASGDDVETTLLLLAVGLAVGQLAARERRARRFAQSSRGEIQRIHRVADSAATGDDPGDVILAAQAELTDLLRLRTCRFEAPPFRQQLPTLDRSGVVPTTEHRLQRGGFELLQEVWGPNDGDETNYLRVHLAHLRRKLEPVPSQPRYLRTEPGMGYRFESE
jgi:Domain of unknown function (DUF4118)/Transcriptional regulatory protein, C terminal